MSGPGSRRPNLPRRGRARAGRLRSQAVCLGLVFLLAALWFAPTGLMILTPGRALALLDRVEVDRAGSRPPEASQPSGGDILLLTAEARPANLYRVAGALLGFPRGAAVLAKRSLVPAGMSDEEFVAYNRALMAESVGLASVVAVCATGGIASAGGAGVRVAAALPGAAGGPFQPGDLITALNGLGLELLGDVARALSGLPAGTPVRAIVLRDGGELELMVSLAPAVPGGEELMLGVLLVTQDPRFQTRPQVRVDTGGIGGPSGGLALALAVYEKLSTGDLLGGRIVAASGQIRLDGTVGAVGGTAQKALAASSAGAAVFLVPRANAAEARAAAPALLVVEVETFDDAVSYLRGSRLTP